MTKKQITYLKELYRLKAQEEILYDFVMNNIDDLVNEDEFFALPFDNLFRWLQPIPCFKVETAKKLLEKMFAAYQNEVGRLLFYIKIDSDDPQIAAYVLSVIDGPLFKQVYDPSPVLDLPKMIDQLKNDNRNLLERFEDQKRIVEGLQQTITTIKQNCEEKTVKISQLMEEIQALQKGNKEGLETLNKFKEEIKSLNSTIQLKNLEIQNKDHDIEKLNRQLAQSKNPPSPNRTIPISSQNIRVFESPISRPNVQDIFEGIFNFMKIEYGDDLCENGIIEVTASSVRYNNTVPSNVLKNDDSLWWSKDVKNSWIQFDFKTRSVSLKSYSLRSRNGPKSWKIEGSNNMNTFTLIDQRNNPNDFKCRECVNQHYNVNGSQDQFRYIRITQGDEGRVGDNNHCFCLTRVEFYGSLYETVTNPK